MKSILICHDGAEIDREVLARWLASFTNLEGIIILKENKSRIIKRIKRELKRSGILRFFDIIAFRIYYRLFQAANDSVWERRKFDELYQKYKELPTDIKILYTHSPNTNEVYDFISSIKPDIMLARCKQIIKKDVFKVPTTGTFVLHPGITPEYRNAYGCFWAIASGDYNKVGTTLLKIDEGVDTGPVYGYYSSSCDVITDSHKIIQHRTLLENLDLIKDKLIEIHAGNANIINTKGRSSGIWGQPWLSAHFSIRNKAKKGAIKIGLSNEINNTTLS